MEYFGDMKNGNISNGFILNNSIKFSTKCGSKKILNYDIVLLYFDTPFLTKIKSI